MTATVTPLLLLCTTCAVYNIHNDWLVRRLIVFLIHYMMRRSSFFPHAVVHASREHSHLCILFCHLVSLVLNVLINVLVCAHTHTHTHTHTLFLMTMTVQVSLLCAHHEPRCSNPPCVLFSLCNLRQSRVNIVPVKLVMYHSSKEKCWSDSHAHYPLKPLYSRFPN